MHRIPLACLATLVIAASLPSAAQAQNRVKVGTLSCEISGAVGMVIGSQKQLSCGFSPSDRAWRRERYVGTMSRLGLDLGATSGGRLIWNVYAPTSARRYALAGNYGGASAEATVGVGLGANVLVGGSNRTIALQPLSIQGQVGASVAGGIAELALRPAR